jgi:hypothetical protein
MWDPKTGDKQFFAMLKDIISTYYTKNMSTVDFKRMVEKHMTPQMDLTGNGKMGWFFNQWVRGNTIPRYKLDYNLLKIDKKKMPHARGKYLLTFDITQSNVYDDFVLRIPIYLELKKYKYIRLGTVAIKGNKTSPQLKIAQLR